MLVEGVSDKIALETLARRRGRELDADGVVVVAIGGAQAARRFVEEYAPRGVKLAGLCDAGEEAEFSRAFGGVADGAFYVCVPDLEGELIRALGADRVEEVVAAHGDLGPFRTLQKQPEWRGRPPEEQLRRFMGSGGRRKTRYARFLVEALDLDAVPEPLDGVLAHVYGHTSE